MYDRCLQMAPQQCRDQLRNEAHETAVVDISVAAEYFADSQHAEWSPDDYCFARPPWQTSFLEWKWSGNTPVYLGEGQIEPKDKGFGAAFCKAYDLNDEGREKLRQKARREDGIADVPLDEVLASIDQAAVNLIILPYQFSNGRLITLPVFGSSLIREDGFVVYSAVLPWAIDKLTEWNLPDDRLATLGVPWMIVTWLGFSFMNCNAGKLIESTEQDQPTAKIRRRLKLPDVRRHTLTVRGYERPKIVGTDGGDVAPRPLHWVRGHFARYTEENKLFGKYVGAFWHPPHQRGKREHGLVEKDYRLGEREAG